MPTITEVETRILTACRTLRALPDPDSRFQQFKGSWPEVIRSTEEAYGFSGAVHPRFRPSPSDVTDYLIALGWARGMDWRQFRLVWWRSFNLSFKQMSNKIHSSDDTARRRYKDIIIKLWATANGYENKA